MISAWVDEGVAHPNLVANQDQCVRHPVKVRNTMAMPFFSLGSLIIDLASSVVSLIRWRR
jgi:hypothetical protein